MNPEYQGMPPTDRVFSVGQWGQIRCGGPCKDDYKRITIYSQDHTHYVKLQAAAIASLKAVERILQTHYPQHPYVFVTGHGWRSCADQTHLYLGDRTRFAPPAETAHCRGLAIDVDMTQDPNKLKAIHAELEKRHWFQARPSGEPWHYSFGIEV